MKQLKLTVQNGLNLTASLQRRTMEWGDILCQKKSTNDFNRFLSETK
jgi:hypothetical protein